MSQAPSRLVPGGAVSTTITHYFQSRANEGTGTFATVASIPNLAVVFANGRSDGWSQELLDQVVITHILNNIASNVWEPQSGDRENLLRNALKAIPVTGTGAAASRFILFDGQFGNVYGGN